MTSMNLQPPPSRSFRPHRLTFHEALAGTVGEALEPLVRIKHRLETADVNDPTISDARLLILAADLLKTLSAIDEQGRRLLAWLPTRGLMG